MPLERVNTEVAVYKTTFSLYSIFLFLNRTNTNEQLNERHFFKLAVVNVHYVMSKAKDIKTSGLQLEAQRLAVELFYKLLIWLLM